MSYYDQNEVQAATAVRPCTDPPVVVVVIPIKDIEAYPQNPPPPPPPSPPKEIKTRGDDFWKGCCADLCCYSCWDFSF